MDTPTIYLAGPVKDRDDSGAVWRDAVAEEHGDEFEFIDPLNKYHPGDDQQPDAETIVTQDLEYIDRCDAMLVRYAGEATWGTPMEVFYADQVHRLPVALAWTGDVQVSPWAEHHSDYLRETTGGAMHALMLHFNGATDPDKFGRGITAYNAQPDVEAAHQAGRGEHFELPSGDELARRLAEDVATLLTDSRETHGDAVENQEHVADAWSWYLDADVTGVDVARMMELAKMSRAVVGDYDLDHDRDIAGYASIAAACAVASGDAALDDLQEHAGGD